MDTPDYYQQLRKKNGNVAEIDIERSILRGWKREWSENPTSCPYHHIDTYSFHKNLPDMHVSGWAQHMLRYQQLMLPKLEINSWIVKMWLDLDKLIFKHKRKIGNFIGSKNSGKSNFFATVVHLLVSIDPEYTRAFVSGPYKTAADATIWGRIETRYNQLKEANPQLWGSTEFVSSRGRCIYSETSGEAGYIELITLDKVGKLQGTKSFDPDRGFLILICDEIAEFPSAALLDALDNLTGNRNFICLTGCNFKNIEGLEGDLCRPEGREYAELHPDIDHDWASNYKSWTFRYDGHLSPNILAGEVVSKYLLQEQGRQDMEDIHGPKGPKYLEQIRSFPNSSMSDYFVTTREKVRAAGGYDEFVWTGIAPRICAFCDPGFGGDPCVIGSFRFGEAFLHSVDGTSYRSFVFEPAESMQIIKIDTTAMADDEFMQRVRNLAGHDSLIRQGKPVTPEQQIAVACGEYLRQRNIPFHCFGYDGSMRASIVHEMLAMLGTQVMSIDFGGMATEREIDQKGTIARDAYFNFVTEMYFNFATTVQAGQFRGGDKVAAAIAQVVRRPWKETGKKKQIVPKDEYKKQNQGRSPNDADVLVGALEVALRLGFRANESRHGEGPQANVNEMMKSLSSLPRFAKVTSKPLRAQ